MRRRANGHADHGAYEHSATDGDRDAETADFHALAHIDARPDEHADAAPNQYRDCDANTHTIANPYSHADPHANAHAHTHPHARTHADRHANGHAHSHRDPDSRDCGGRTDGDARSDGHADSIANAIPHAIPHAAAADTDRRAAAASTRPAADSEWIRARDAARWDLVHLQRRSDRGVG